MQTQTQMEMQASSHVQRKRKEREIRKRKKYFSKMANNDWAFADHTCGKRTQIQTSENENGSSYKLLCYTKIFHDIDKGRNLSEVRIDND